MKKKLEQILDEAKKELDHPIRGLKESSNTNKTRYAILALIEEAYELGKNPPEESEVEGHRVGCPCATCHRHYGKVSS